MVSFFFLRDRHRDQLSTCYVPPVPAYAIVGRGEHRPGPAYHHRADPVAAWPPTRSRILGLWPCTAPSLCCRLTLLLSLPSLSGPGLHRRNPCCSWPPACPRFFLLLSFRLGSALCAFTFFLVLLPRPQHRYPSRSSFSRPPGRRVLPAVLPAVNQARTASVRINKGL